MRRGFWWFGLLLLLVFLAVVLARLPARWLTSRLPAEFICVDPGGTLWHGECTSMAVRGTPIGAISWDLKPLGLLALRLDAEIRVTGANLNLTTAASVRRNGDASFSDLKLNMALPTALAPRLPADLSGALSADLATLRIESGWVRAISGRIELRKLFSGGPEPAPLGNFEVKFSDPPTDGKLLGQVRDLGGPLQVEGSITLQPTPGYLLQGTVAARAEANEALRKQLAQLGTPDAAQRYRFAQEAEL